MTNAPATRLTMAGLFLITLGTMMLEILLTRIFSVTMWYHFAFVAISLAMFGMTVGALKVYRHPELYGENSTKRQMALSGLWFARICAFPVTANASGGLDRSHVLRAYGSVLLQRGLCLYGSDEISQERQRSLCRRFTWRSDRLHCADLCVEGDRCADRGGVGRVARLLGCGVVCRRRR